MTLQEFSDEFDVLYNNISSNQAPGLNEYEKSVFLTKAQNEIVKNYFTSTQGGNKYQQGFDDSAKRQIDFSTLLVQEACPLIKVDSKRGTDILEGVTIPGNIYGSAPEAVLFNAPSFIDKILLVVSERIIIKDTDNNVDKYYQVVPIKLDSLLNNLSKPYGRPLKRQVWRVIETFGDPKGSEDQTVIPTKYNGFRFILHDADEQFLGESGGESPKDTKAIYFITYLIKPKPIVLENLVGVSVDGESLKSECVLNSELHPEILQRAVELAKSAYMGDLKSSVELGQRSE